jgi:hypothetical protein
MSVFCGCILKSTIEKIKCDRDEELYKELRID